MKLILKFFTVVTFILKCNGIVNIDEDRRQLIDEFVESVIFDCPIHNIVSMNLAVVHKGEVAYTTAYGLKDLETGENATEDSVYAIASVSKHFTSLLLGQIMKEDGRYNWNSRVKDILGEDFYFQDLLRTNLSRPSDLASHSTGVPRYDSVVTTGATRAEIADRLRFLPGRIEPRTSFLYNNVMYHMLGHLTEAISGTEWEELLQTRFFDAVEMSNTSLNYLVTDDNLDLAKPYKIQNGEYREVNLDVHRSWMKPAGGSGAILSTANDMARWMNMIVNEGMIDGRRVVDSDVLAKIATGVNAHVWNPASNPTVKPRTPVTIDLGPYGLGLYRGSYRGLRTFIHGGSLDGHYSGIYMLPDVDLGICMTVSGVEGSDTSTPIFSYIADLMLGFEPWLNTTTGCSYPELHNIQKQRDFDLEPQNLRVKLTEKAIEISRNFLEQNTGEFGNFGYGNFTVSFDDVENALILRIGEYHNYRLIPLSPQTNVTFFAQGFEPNWEYSFAPVVFYDDGNFVNVTFVSNDGPVTFQRGLLFSEAPEPGFDIC